MSPWGTWVGIEFFHLWISFCSKLHQPYSMYICVVNVIEKFVNEQFWSLSSQSCCTLCPNCEKLINTPMVLQTFVVAKIKDFAFDIIWQGWRLGVHHLSLQSNGRRHFIFISSINFGEYSKDKDEELQLTYKNVSYFQLIKITIKLFDIKLEAIWKNCLINQTSIKVSISFHHIIV